MKKITGILMAMLITASMTHATIVYEEQFDGNGHAYDVDENDGAVNVWTDFNNRITTAGIGSATEGYRTAHLGTDTVLAGQVIANNDPQVRTSFDVDVAAPSVTNISLRIRVDKDLSGAFDASDSLTITQVDLFYGTTLYGDNAANNTVASNIRLQTLTGVTPSITAADASGWVVVNYAFTADTLGTGTDLIHNFRIDPANSIQGANFEIDYLRVEAIPEPATLGMIAAMGGALLFIRRRFMI
ncbi:PEP-CTERM sorting domain-containing protein [Pontiellaceae bacterium B12227]|nr:PEP-CTERM sorting domain-containing protein [Pontiellaceae bacterium B12227]